MIIGELIDKGQNHRSPNYDFSPSASATPNLPGSRELGTGAFFTQKKGGASEMFFWLFSGRVASQISSFNKKNTVFSSCFVITETKVTN